MKLILTEEQYDELNLKIYGGLIDMLVKQTKIFGGKQLGYNKFDYTAHILFPYSENSYDLAFNSPSEFTFTSPARYGLKIWFLMVDVDIDKEPKKAEKLWNMYLDKLEVKIKDYIKNFIDNEN